MTASLGGYSFSPAVSELSTVDSTITADVGVGLVNNGWSLSQALSLVQTGKRLYFGCGANGCAVSLANPAYSWDPTAENVFDVATDAVVAALAQITGSYVQSAVIWVHGETDSSAAGSVAYETNMEALIAAWEAKCGAPAEWVFTTLADTQTALNATYAATVRDAQYALGETHGRTIETNGTPVKEDNIHFTSVGKLMIAEDIAG
jgi:hypothetical protein